MSKKKLVLQEHIPFQKIPRLNRDIVISEKIDGTCGTVIIDEFKEQTPEQVAANVGAMVSYDIPEKGWGTYVVRAASKNQVCTPGVNDNHGFAAWVYENATELATALGQGQFSGEWYGHGIQRGYGLEKGDRRFAFFNPTLPVPPCADIVPVLYEGPRLLPTGECAVVFYVRKLSYSGSEAVRGWKDPEGVVIFHTAANRMFKVTIKDDASPKGA